MSRSHLEAEFVLRNRGEAVGPRQSIRFVLGRLATPGKGDLALQESLVPPIRPRGEHKTTLQVELPPGVSASGKYLIAILGAPVAAEDGSTSRFLAIGPFP
jgi:hypothetical protein